MKLDVDGFNYILKKEEKVIGLITSKRFILKDERAMKKFISYIISLYKTKEDEI